jgi:hypothetical protein
MSEGSLRKKAVYLVVTPSFQMSVAIALMTPPDAVLELTA